MQGAWLIAFLIQWAIVLILAALVMGILRYLYSVQERWNLAVPAISKYELWQRIDDFELPDRGGTIVRSQDLFKPSGAVILFLTINCPSCTTLVSQVSELVTRSSADLSRPLILIALGAPEKVEQLFNLYHGLMNDRVSILIDEKGAILRQFGIDALPTGLAVDHDGRLVHQTFNPHAANWLYSVTEVSPPEKPVAKGWQEIILPAAYRG